jgi:hypothetical protein
VDKLLPASLEGRSVADKLLLLPASLEGKSVADKLLLLPASLEGGSVADKLLLRLQLQARLMGRTSTDNLLLY